MVRLRKRFRRLTGKPAPSRTSHAALSRSIQAIESGQDGPLRVRTSRYGAPGGLYLVQVDPRPPSKKRGTRPVRKGPKIRRLPRAKALALFRRKVGDPKVLPSDRMTVVWWIPPELVLLLPRDRLISWVRRGKVRPVWRHGEGKLVERGASVV